MHVFGPGDNAEFNNGADKNSADKNSAEFNKNSADNSEQKSTPALINSALPNSVASNQSGGTRQPGRSSSYLESRRAAQADPGAEMEEFPGAGDPLNATHRHTSEDPRELTDEESYNTSNSYQENLVSENPDNQKGGSMHDSSTAFPNSAATTRNDSIPRRLEVLGDIPDSDATSVSRGVPQSSQAGHADHPSQGREAGSAAQECDNTSSEDRSSMSDKGAKPEAQWNSGSWDSQETRGDRKTQGSPDSDIPKPEWMTRVEEFKRKYEAEEREREAREARESREAQGAQGARGAQGTRGAQGAQGTQGGPHDAGDAGDAIKQKYAEAALRTQVKELSAVPSGQRNQALFTSSLKLGNFVGEGYLDEATVRGELLGACQRNGLIEDDGRTQCIQTISSGLKTGKLRPATWPDEWKISTDPSTGEYTSSDWIDPELVNSPANWADEYQWLIKDAQDAQDAQGSQDAQDAQGSQGSRDNSERNPVQGSQNTQSTQDTQDRTSSRDKQGTANPGAPLEGAASSRGSVTPPGTPAGVSVPQSGASGSVSQTQQTTPPTTQPAQSTLQQSSTQNSSSSPQASGTGANSLHASTGTSASLLDFPEDFFTQSDVLTHIRNAAHSRLISSQGVLVAVLARILTEAGPHIMVPKTIGSNQPLNLGFNLTGDSGGGKSSALKASAELLGLDQSKLERELGTGEGLVDSYMVPSPLRGQPPVLSSDPRRLFLVEEVEKMEALIARQGSSLGADLRAGLMGQNMGAANSTAGGKSRHLPRDSYRLVLMVGTQPAHSGFLLAGASSGFPQRFLWVGFRDRTLPKELSQIPADPGPLNWVNPWPEFDPNSPNPQFVIPIDPQIVTEIQLARINAEHAEPEDVDIKRSHIQLTKLKVASGLSVLHGEVNISLHWWEMAGVLTEHSIAVQQYCEDLLQEEINKKNARQAVARGHGKYIQEEIYQRRMDNLFQSLYTRLGKMICGSGQPVTNREIAHSLKSSERKLKNQVLEQLLEDEIIEKITIGGPGTGRKSSTAYVKNSH